MAAAAGCYGASERGGVFLRPGRRQVGVGGQSQVLRVDELRISSLLTRLTNDLAVSRRAS